MSLAFKVIKQQRGAALILALLIVSIVVILSASLASDFLVALRRVENQLHSQQAYAYLRGAEVMARQVLQDDFKKDSKKDHISEKWLEVDQDIPLLDESGLKDENNKKSVKGALRGRLSDLQGRFNVNNLPGKPRRSTNPGNPGKSPSERTFTQAQSQFIRLLQLLPLEQRLDRVVAEDLMWAVVDWIDVDDNTSPQGAETAYYSGLELPMRAASKPLHSVSELLWVKGMTKEIYTALKPFVTALPAGTKINVNTASVQVLQALVDGGTGSEAEQIKSDRDGNVDVDVDARVDVIDKNSAQGFESVAEFTRSFMAAVGGGRTTAPDVQVNSEYFLLSAQAVFLDRLFQMQSVLHRNTEGIIKVYARSYTDI